GLERLEKATPLCDPPMIVWLYCVNGEDSDLRQAVISGNAITGRRGDTLRREEGETAEAFEERARQRCRELNGEGA
ncbi:hypothetical protein OW493_17135, partial [Cobetia sp. 14N.309.X.WAT.E.A4]|uniref:hypothetical protein n=1 Tax=Cobetia sp. 14N.309.X.WAT.E.A4 TaxID=2998323 RepID=UPI0025B2011C